VLHGVVFALIGVLIAYLIVSAQRQPSRILLLVIAGGFAAWYYQEPIRQFASDLATEVEAQMNRETPAATTATAPAGAPLARAPTVTDEAPAMVLAPGATLPATTEPEQAAPQASETELEFWKAIQNSTDAAEFEFYLEQFPEGTYAALARHKIARLNAQAVPAAESTVRLEAEAAEKQRRETEEKARQEAEAKARHEAEEARRAAQAKAEAEARARAEAEARAKKVAEEMAQRQAAEKAKRDAEAKAKREADERARQAAALAASPKRPRPPRNFFGAAALNRCCSESLPKCATAQRSPGMLNALLADESVIVRPAISGESVANGTWR